MKVRAEHEWSSVAELADALTPELERSMTAVWPDRPWFFEIWSESEALTQVYAPHGMPIRR